MVAYWRKAFRKSPFLSNILEGQSCKEAICSLALSLSDNRLESFRISKFPASILTSVKPDSVLLVDCGILDLVGLETGRGAIFGNEVSWSAATCCRPHVQTPVLKCWQREWLQGSKLRRWLGHPIPKILGTTMGRSLRCCFRHLALLFWNQI